MQSPLVTSLLFLDGGTEDGEPLGADEPQLHSSPSSCQIQNVRRYDSHVYTVLERHVGISLTSGITELRCHHRAGGDGTTQEISVCWSRVVTKSIKMSSSIMSSCVVARHDWGTGNKVSMLLFQFMLS